MYTKGEICKDENCLEEELTNNKKILIIGEFLFVRISLKDKTNLKFL